jgi:hypothetical protein
VAKLERRPPEHLPPGTCSLVGWPTCPSCRPRPAQDRPRRDRSVQSDPNIAALSAWANSKNSLGPCVQQRLVALQMMFGMQRSPANCLSTHRAAALPWGVLTCLDRHGPSSAGTAQPAKTVGSLQKGLSVAVAGADPGRRASRHQARCPPRRGRAVAVKRESSPGPARPRTVGCQ